MYCSAGGRRGRTGPTRIAVSTSVPPAGGERVDARLRAAGRRLGHGEHRERPEQRQQHDDGDPGHRATASPGRRRRPTIAAPAIIAKA